MDTIKNILKPGAKQEDEILYGSGQGSNLDTVSGQGSHFGNSRTSAGDPSTSGPSSDFKQPIGAATTNTGSGVGRATASSTDGSNINKPLPNQPLSGSTGASNALPDRTLGNTEQGTRGQGDYLRESNDPASERSFPLGGHRSNAQAANQTTGPHNSNLLNKLDPRVDNRQVDSNAPRNSTLNSNTAGYGSNTADPGSNTSGLGSTTRATAGEPAHHGHLGRDAAIGGAGLGAAGLAEHERERWDDRRNERVAESTTGYGSGVSGTGASTAGYGSNTGSGIGGLGQSSTGHGPGTASNTGGLGTSSTGYQSGTGAAISDAGATNGRYDSGIGSNNTSGIAGQGHGTGSTVGSSHHGHLGRDAAIGGAGIGAVGLAEHERERHAERREERGTGHDSAFSGSTTGPTLHQHGTHGHNYQGDPCGPGEVAPGAPHFTTGPHATDTANRLDPSVGSGIGSTAGTGSTGANTVDAQHERGNRHLGRDAAGAGIVGAGVYEAEKHHHQHSHHEHHRDERVGDQSASQHRDHHFGRDAAGAGLVGGAAYEVEKHHHHHPHDSEGAREKHDGQHHDHHRGKDVAGAGLVGGAAYEADKHHHHHDQSTGATGNTTNQVTSGATGGTVLTGPVHKSNILNKLDPRVKEVDAASVGVGSATTANAPTDAHHHGRDATAVGTGGGALNEAEKYPHRDHVTGGTALAGNPSNLESADPRIDSTSYGGQTNLAGTQQGTTAGGLSQSSDNRHHLGRDAGIAGTAGLGAYEVEKHHHDHHGHHHDQPVGSTGVAGASGYPVSSYDDSTRANEGVGRTEAGSLGTETTGAGTTGISSHESRKEQKALEKEERHEDKEKRREEKQDGKKHGGILGLFRRGDKGDREGEEEGSSSQPLDDTHERNRLHKDPPPSMLRAAEEGKYGNAPQSGYGNTTSAGVPDLGDSGINNATHRLDRTE